VAKGARLPVQRRDDAAAATMGRIRVALGARVVSPFFPLLNIMSLYQVRPAVARDAATIAAIHVNTWQEAYEGLLPEADLKSHLGRQAPEVLARGHPVWRSPGACGGG
jgi:hypothetical protein